LLAKLLSGRASGSLLLAQGAHRLLKFGYLRFQFFTAGCALALYFSDFLASYFSLSWRIKFQSLIL
jgi:hypothetical protein